MEKVSYVTNRILVKASTDSERDDCTFAIIYTTKQWIKLLAKRSSWLIPFKNDDLFYSLTFWDAHVDFFVHTGNDVEDPLYGSDLMEPDEILSHVSVTESELNRFKRPGNKIRGHQLNIMRDGYMQFLAWGYRPGEKFYTERLSIEAFIKQ